MEFGIFEAECVRGEAQQGTASIPPEPIETAGESETSLMVYASAQRSSYVSGDRRNHLYRGIGPNGPKDRHRDKESRGLSEL